jgi:hypothetical protein
MQNYTEIPSTTTLSDSLSQILNNDKTALSLSSGTAFPTVNLQLGMPCFRTDEQKLYILTVVSPVTWKMVIDLSATVGKVANADLLDGIDSTGFALSGHNHDAAYAALGHNHNAAYLGITAKAADADKLDGYDSTAFVRSVNGYGPDANGNSTVPVDLSSRVAKAGDTMTGQLTIQNRLRVGEGTSAWIDLTDDESPNGVKRIHANSNLVGFVGGDGNWKQYVNESGQMWAANYGWLHERFATRETVWGQGGARDTGYRTNCGNINCNSWTNNGYEIFDVGDGRHQLRAYYGLRISWNCDCNCACGC